jgi:ribonuclease BN (tRNA processing enzyme)
MTPGKGETRVRAWILGTAGWMPAAGRATTSVLVRDGERALVLDAGTGASRLVWVPELLDGVQRLDVLLTHFHLDHVCGLLYLPATGLPVRIHAPGAWLYGTPSAELLGPILRAPLSPFTEPFDVRELDPRGDEIAGFRVSLRAQPRHWAPTAGIRVGDSVALVTDTAFDEGSAGFVAGVRHLLHEAWSTSQRPSGAEGDATAADAGQVAAAGRVGRLTLLHLHPRADPAALERDARTAFEAAEVGVDGRELTL